MKHGAGEAECHNTLWLRSGSFTMEKQQKLRKKQTSATGGCKVGSPKNPIIQIVPQEIECWPFLYCSIA